MKTFKVSIFWPSVYPKNRLRPMLRNKVVKDKYCARNIIDLLDDLRQHGVAYKQIKKIEECE